MLVVNRQAFMAWCDGILLERDSQGHVLVGDHVKHEQVEDLLEAGQKVGLQGPDGKVSSYLVLDEGSDTYIEVQGAPE